MKDVSKAIVVMVAMFLAFQVGYALAEQSPEELAKETETACVATENVKPTPEMIMSKVDEAVALIEKEGAAAFPKFKGKDSKFIFAGTYIWIHDLAGVMRMHPIKYKLDGKSIIDMKDTDGKLFFTEMNQVCKDKGAGWVDYKWPKPGEAQSSVKVSYVKMAKHGGESFVVGCGVYGVTQEEIQKAMKK